MNMIVGIAGEIRTWVHKIIVAQRRQSIGYAEQREMIGAGVQVKDHLTAILEKYAKYANSEFEPRLTPSLPRGDPWPSWEITKELPLGPIGYSQIELAVRDVYQMLHVSDRITLVADTVRNCVLDERLTEVDAGYICSSFGQHAAEAALPTPKVDNVEPAHVTHGLQHP